MTQPTRIIMVCIMLIIPLLIMGDIEGVFIRNILRMAYFVSLFALYANLPEKPTKP